MLDTGIKEYLSKVGITRVSELDTALLEAYGQDEGEAHIRRLTELFDQSEQRLLYGTGDTPYFQRQEELVDYLNQSLQMSLLAASFYDRVFFRRVMEYLLKYDSYLNGDMLDVGCGNGILTCFLALKHSSSMVTGLDLSAKAVAVAKELAGGLQAGNVEFIHAKASQRSRLCDTLFSCRTVHENIAGRALYKKSEKDQAKRYETYAGELAVLVRPGGNLVSVERYEDDSAYAAFVHALERTGFCQIRGTYMQFSCRDGDKTARFQGMIFQKTKK